MKDGSTLDLALDAYGPARIAERVESAGIGKAALGIGQLLTLAVLAGAFIGFGGIFYLLAMTGADPGVGADRIIGGLAFSLGLVLVIVAGAELFTGNALIVIAWADGAVGAGALLRNWSIAYIGNFVGAIALAWAVVLAGTLEIGGGGLRELAVDVARAKTELAFGPAFLRGVLCNILVCLAVWLAMGGRSVTDKVVAITEINALLPSASQGRCSDWVYWFRLPVSSVEYSLTSAHTTR